VILTVHEMKRLARNAAELMTLAGALQAAAIQLELLSGPLTGIYDPNGMGAMLFAVLAVVAQLDREYIREKTLEGQQAAAARGNHGGRPKVIDDDMLTFAAALRDKGVPMPEITLISTRPRRVRGLWRRSWMSGRRLKLVRAQAARTSSRSV
jgi:DNA invertase Pin-like site-specific DNA recombinase